MDLQRLQAYLQIVERASRLAPCSMWQWWLNAPKMAEDAPRIAYVEFGCVEGNKHCVHKGIVTFMDDGTACAKYVITCAGSESVSHIGAEWLRSGGAKEHILWDRAGQLTWSGACNFLLLMVLASDEDAVPVIEQNLELELRHIRTLPLYEKA